jgi:hypothetical protein
VLALFLRAGRPGDRRHLDPDLAGQRLPRAASDGRSLNIIALAGLSFAVGLVVDDAIVVLENIDRHMRERGKPPRQAALEGLQEVWGAIFSSTLTRIAVFIPIIMNVTEAGLLFKDIAIAVVTSITVSLLVTLTVVPSMAALLMRVDSTRERIARENPKLSAFLDIFELQWLGKGFGGSPAVSELGLLGIGRNHRRAVLRGGGVRAVPGRWLSCPRPATCRAGPEVHLLHRPAGGRPAQ